MFDDSLDQLKKYLNGCLLVSICLFGTVLLAEPAAEDENVPVVTEEALPAEGSEPEIGLEPELEFAESSFGFNQSVYKEQIACPEDDCVRLVFNKDTVDDQINDLMAENAGRILIDLQEYSYRIDDDAISDIGDYLRAISKREGRVVIEPVYIGARGALLTAANFSFASDFLTVGYSIFTRVYSYFHYSDTENYHAKVLFNPASDKKEALLVYFVHRNYGDICRTLYSSCEVLEYFDNDAFDQSLSQQLEEGLKRNKSVKVLFNNTEAFLPTTEISAETLEQMNQSSRLYKWFIAAGETEKRKSARERFITLQTAFSIISYSLQVYDAIQALLMYLPARGMKADIVYSGEESGGQIESIVFTPLEKSEGAEGSGESEESNSE